MPVQSGELIGMLLAEAADASGQPNAMAINPDLALFSLIAFALLFLVLAKFGWKPIMEGLNQREQLIADQIEAAERGQKKSEALMAEYEAKLAAAGDEASRIFAQAKKDAETARERIVAEAGAEAERQRQRAIADIQGAKDAAMQELAQKSVNSAVSLAGNLIGKEVDTSLHEKLIKESLDRFGNQN